MQARRVKDVIEGLEEVKSFMLRHSDRPDAARDVTASDILKKLESDFAFAKLNQILRENASCDEEASPAHLKIFYDFLSERWQVIRNTDAAYSVAPHSTINLVCKVLANSLAPVYQQPEWACLMPTIKLPESVQAFSDRLGELAWHEYVIGEDGVPLILADCFDYLQRRSRVSSGSAHSAQVFYLPAFVLDSSPLPRHLTVDEEQYLHHHSREAEGYYAAIKLGLDDVDAYRAGFLDALKRSDYCMSASYGEAGVQRLMRHLVRHLSSPLELSRLMQQYLLKSHWDLFLKTMHETDLFRIMLNVDLDQLKKDNPNGETFQAVRLQKIDEAMLAVINTQYVFHDREQIRAFLFCLLTCYRLSRREGPQYKTYAGTYVGSLFSMAYSRDIKLQACDVYEDFLLSDRPYRLEGLEAYLRERRLHEQLAGPLMAQSRLGNNILPSLVQMGARLELSLESRASVTPSLTGL